MNKVPEEAAIISISSLSASSLKQYDTGLKKWWFFSIANSNSPFSCSVPEILNFLTTEYNKGASYGSLNSFRSAIALIAGSSLGEDARVKRFFKGIANLRPPQPKYDSTWDPAIVLNKMRDWGSNENLTLKDISYKLSTLLALVTGHRVQTLRVIDIRNIIKSDNALEIKIPDKIKISKVYKLQPSLILPFFAEETLICPATTLEAYLSKTVGLRGLENKLFISFKKPHKPVSSQSLSRWIKQMLQGIDTSIFSAHSTRHASTSTAKRDGVNIDLILKTAGWTPNSQSFARFYNRSITKANNTFALSILKHKQ